jgi:hypothetical protein
MSFCIVSISEPTDHEAPLTIAERNRAWYRRRRIEILGRSIGCFLDTPTVRSKRHETSGQILEFRVRIFIAQIARVLMNAEDRKTLLVGQCCAQDMIGDLWEMR